VIQKISLIFAVLLILTPASVSALSQDQLDTYNSGINYFDTEQAVSSATACSDFGVGTLPAVIPSKANGIFTAAASKLGVPAALVGAIYFVETNGKQGTDPSVYKWRDPPPPYGSGEPWLDSHVLGGNEPWPKGEHDGAAGPFQFEYPAWSSNEMDGNGDGQKDVEDLTDAAFAAAHYLSGLLNRAGGNIEQAAGGYEAGHPVDSEYGRDAYALYQYLSGGSTATAGSQTAASGSCSTSDSLGPVNIQKINAFGAGDRLMGHQPTMVGVHYTAGHEQTAQDVINSLRSNNTGSCSASGCSVQLTVLPDGSVYQLTSRLDVVTENIINFNDADVGIEIAGMNEASLLANQKQFDAVVALVAQLMQKYNIKMQQDFENKAGLMGHFECDDWSDSHKGGTFSGQYKDEPINGTGGHRDPGPTYMSNLRSSVGQALGQ
jgi:hypothetical protein